VRTRKIWIENSEGDGSFLADALVWGNNAAWVCIQCQELLGGRTGDTEYEVDCTRPGCTATYRIQRSENKNGGLNLGPASGVRKIR
jgi:hypothetical protein